MEPQITPLFVARTNGYHTYRIPALVATTRGTLLAFCEARRGRGGDWDPIDILMRRSEDGGATWEEPRVIASSAEVPMSNATPIVDRELGCVHLLYQSNYARVFYTRSDDDGQSFAPPVEITSVLEGLRPQYPWRVVAPGPGHAIQLDDGRLVVAVWMSTGAGTEFGPGKLGHRPSCVTIIVSDDHGQTWWHGDIVVDTDDRVVHPSETMPVQLADGRVLLNIRSEAGEHRRLTSTSADGLTGWSRPGFHPDLYEPVCMASILRLTRAPADDRHRLLFSNPDSRHNSTMIRGLFGVRENLCVKLSYDEGETWPVSKPLDPGYAGYSDLAATADGSIYCLYEGAAIDQNMFDNGHVSVARFDLAWLTDGRDTWPRAAAPTTE